MRRLPSAPPLVTMQDLTPSQARVASVASSVPNGDVLTPGSSVSFHLSFTSRGQA